MLILKKIFTFFVDLAWYILVILYPYLKAILSFLAFIYFIKVIITWDESPGDNLIIFTSLFISLTALMLFITKYKPKNFSG